MYGLTIGDLLLFPVYLYIIYRIFKRLRLKYTHDAVLVKYFTWGYYIKLCFILVYTLLVCYVIFGDSVSLFFGEGRHFHDMILQDPKNIDLLFTNGGKTIDELAGSDYKGYLAMESNYMVVKISAILCFITFSKYLIINLICGFIAFLGSWQLFVFFYRLYPKLHKQFAIACLCIPTVIFWSSGISKDTVCIASIGFLTKSLYDLAIDKRRILFNTLVIIIAIYLTYSIKPYIIISYLPIYLFFLTLHLIGKTEDPLFRLILKVFIPVIFLSTLLFVIINNEVLFQDYSSEKILESVSQTQDAFNKQSESYDGSFFSLGEFDGSLSGLILKAPQAIVATLFRPFLWECRNLIMVLSSLESLAFLLITLRLFFSKKGIIIFFRSLLRNPVVFYCILFSLVFSVFVGLSTFNFGSLVRYRIPCLPFFAAALFLVFHFSRTKTSSLKE